MWTNIIMILTEGVREVEFDTLKKMAPVLFRSPLVKTFLFFQGVHGTVREKERCCGQRSSVVVWFFDNQDFITFIICKFLVRTATIFLKHFLILFCTWKLPQTVQNWISVLWIFVSNDLWYYIWVWWYFY